MSHQLWALDQDNTWHALDQAWAIAERRSLCGVRVVVDEKFVVGDPAHTSDQHGRELGRRCRSCLEKLEAPVATRCNRQLVGPSGYIEAVCMLAKGHAGKHSPR